MIYYNKEEALKLLELAGLFFDTNNPDFKQRLNLNDTFAWACSESEYVPDEELPRLAELFWRYGYCGVLYWVSERRGGYKSEFHDINRFIQFVREEEKIRQEEPSSTERAYLKKQYTIGEGE